MSIYDHAKVAVSMKRPQKFVLQVMKAKQMRPTYEPYRESHHDGADEQPHERQACPEAQQQVHKVRQHDVGSRYGSRYTAAGERYSISSYLR